MCKHGALLWHSQFGFFQNWTQCNIIDIYWKMYGMKYSALLCPRQFIRAYLFMRKIKFYSMSTTSITKLFKITNVSFFWDLNQDMSSSGLPQKKNQASDWRTYLIYQLEACFFGGKLLLTHVLTQISEKNWL